MNCVSVSCPLSAVLTLVRRLTDWLSTDALRFEVLFVRSGGDKPLGDEAELLQLLLREPIERGAAEVRWVDGPAAVEQFLLETARHSQVHCLTLSADPVRLDPEGVVVSRLTVDGPRPNLTDGNGRDVFVRAFAAARLDLLVMLVGVAVPLLGGTLIGTLVAYSRSKLVDAVVGRLIDSIIAFPFLVLVLAEFPLNGLQLG